MMFKRDSKKFLTAFVVIIMVFSSLAILSFATEPASAATTGTLTADYSNLYVNQPNAVLISGGSFSQGAPLYYEFLQTNGWVPHSYDWLALTPPNTTLNNALIVLNPTSAGSWYLLVSDTHNGKNGVISLEFTASAETPGSFQVVPASGSETALLPGWTSNSPQSATIFGSGIGPTDSITVSMLEGWTPAAVYQFPTSGTNSINNVISSQVFTGAQLESGSGGSFTLPFVPGGDYAFIAVDTTTSSPLNAANTSGTNDFFTLTGFIYTAYPSSPNYFYPGTFAFSRPVSLDATGPLQLFTVTPSIVYSVESLSGQSNEIFSFTGYGFVAGDTFSLSSSTVELSNSTHSNTIPLTFTTPATVQANGEVSFTGVRLSSSTTVTGYYFPVLMDDQGVSYSPITHFIFSSGAGTYYANGIYISIPNNEGPGFYFYPVPMGGLYYPGITPFVVAIFNFSANSVISIYIGPVLVGSITTDSNGYGVLNGNVPAMPAGDYIVTAVDSALSLTVVPNSPTGALGTSSNELTLTPFFQLTDPSGNVLTYEDPFLVISAGEFVPQDGTLTVTAYGLAPETPYAATDTAIGNIAQYGTNVSTSTGSVASGGIGFIPSLNGTLVFSYQPYYGYYGVFTGAASLVTLGSVAGLGGSMGYGQIGAPYISTDPKVEHPGGLISLNVSNLLFSVSDQTFYPGTYDSFNLYLGNTQIMSTSPSGVKNLSKVQLASGITFNVPSVASGLYNISIVYQGQQLSTSLPFFNTSGAMLVVSTPSTVSTSGGIGTVQVYVSGGFAGYAIYGDGLLSGASAHLVIYSGSGPVTSHKVASTGAYGGFFDYALTDLAIGSPILASDPAGTYGIVLTVGPETSSPVEFYTSYTVGASLEFSSPDGSYYGGLYFDYVTDVVTLVPGGQSGLITGAFYDLYFNSVYVQTIQAVSSSSFGTGVTFSVPVLPSGLYTVKLTRAQSSTVVTSAEFYILPSPTVTLLNSSGYAFPGQLVYFSWTPTTGNLPHLVGGEYGPVQVTAYLNGTAYTTFPAAFDGNYINGSFKMPNDAVGTYWLVTLGWTQKFYNSSNASTADLTLKTTSFTATSIAPINAEESATFTLTYAQQQVLSVTEISLTFSTAPLNYVANITGWSQSGTTVTVYFSLYILPSAIGSLSISSGTASYTYLSPNSTKLSSILVSSFSATLAPIRVSDSATFVALGQVQSVTQISLTFSTTPQAYAANITGWNWDNATGVATLNFSLYILPSSISTITITSGNVFYNYYYTGVSYNTTPDSVYFGTSDTFYNLSEVANFTVNGTLYGTPVLNNWVGASSASFNDVTENVTSWVQVGNNVLVRYNLNVYIIDYGTIYFSSLNLSYNSILSTNTSLTNSNFTNSGPFGGSYSPISVADEAMFTTTSTVHSVTSLIMGVVGTSHAYANVTGWSQSGNDVNVYFSLFLVPEAASITLVPQSSIASYLYLAYANSDLTVSGSYTAVYKPLVIAESGNFSASRTVQLVTNVSLTLTGASSWYSNITSWTQNNVTKLVTVYFSLYIQPTSSPVTVDTANASILYPSVTLVNNFTQPPINGSYLQLISGKGALLTGITSGQIATLEADVYGTITTAMSVPLSELNAAITSLNGTSVQITTSFGNMTTTLSAINATVSAIANGQVTVETDLGSVSTSLASLNSSIVALHGLTVELNSTLGPIHTTLEGINLVVTSNANSLSTLKGSAVTITTDLGTINGKVSDISNGTASIQTTLGTIQTNVSSIKTTTHVFPTFEILLIVILVLVIISLIGSFLAVSAANKAARRAAEQKKE